MVKGRPKGIVPNMDVINFPIPNNAWEGDFTPEQIATLLWNTSGVPGVHYDNNYDYARFFYMVFDKLRRDLSNKSDYEKAELSEKPDILLCNTFQKIAEGYLRWSSVDRPLLRLSKIVFQLWYEKMREWERSNAKRIHKGSPLHQIGIISEEEGQMDDAYNYYFLAWVEDVLTHKKYNDGQAYRRLSFLFRVTDRMLSNISIFVSSSREFAPELILKEVKKRYTLPTYAELTSVSTERVQDSKCDWEGLLSEWENRKVTNKVSTTAPHKFEDFSENLFSAVQGLIPRGTRRNATTSAGTKEHDYDLIFLNDSKILSYLGDYILMECKDTSRPSEYGDIAKFILKVQSRHCQTGFIISMSGVIGNKYNETIRGIFSSHGITILTFDNKDITDILSGDINLAALIRTKYEQIRFKIA